MCLANWKTTILCLVILLLTFNRGFAAEEIKTSNFPGEVAAFSLYSWTLEMEGKKVLMPGRPVIKNNSVYIQLPYLAKILQLEKYSVHKDSVFLKKADKVAEIKVTKLLKNHQSLKVNEQKYELIPSEFILQGRLESAAPYVEVKTIAKIFGYALREDLDNQSFYIVQDNKPLQDADFKIAGLQIGLDKEDRLKEIMGKSKDEIKILPGPSGNWYEARYPDVRVRVYKLIDHTWRVESIQVLSPEYPTSRGLKVGDSFEKMIDLYGPAYAVDLKNPNKYIYSVFNSCWRRQTISFVIDNNAIKEIAVFNGVYG